MCFWVLHKCNEQKIERRKKTHRTQNSFDWNGIDWSVLMGIWLNERWQSLLLVSFCHFVDLFWSQFRRLSVTIEIIKASLNATLLNCVVCRPNKNNANHVFVISCPIFFPVSLYIFVWIVYFSLSDRYQRLIFNVHTDTHSHTKWKRNARNAEPDGKMKWHKTNERNTTT